jgi:hypothetical protein
MIRQSKWSVFLYGEKCFNARHYLSQALAIFEKVSAAKTEKARLWVLDQVCVAGCGEWDEVSVRGSLAKV